MFLQRFGFGGCLADDMGLGKTVMVLALLDARRADNRGDQERRPSLVVAPRSVVFNWRQEAARFTPDLRVLEYAGTGRAAMRALFAEHDIVLTTYGTLRRDAASAVGRAVRLRHPRRGAGDQERRERVGENDARAERAAPAGA